MTSVYVESSALAAMVLNQPGGEEVRAELSAASELCATWLTVVESRRALVAARARGIEVPTDAADVLEETLGLLAIADLSEDVRVRAERPFPMEPIRALDALHVAAAQKLHGRDSSLAVLSLDRRVRDNARALGITVLP